MIMEEEEEEEEEEEVCVCVLMEETITSLCVRSDRCKPHLKSHLYHHRSASVDIRSRV